MSELQAGFGDWITCPWTWAGAALSIATLKLGHWTFLSLKKQKRAAQVDRARDNLRSEEESVRLLAQLRIELEQSKVIEEDQYNRIMRRINYPDDEQFAQDLRSVNNTSMKSSQNKTRCEKVESHLRDVIGKKERNKPGSIPFVPKAHELHKRQLKTLALGTITIACAIGAGESWVQSCQK